MRYSLLPSLPAADWEQLESLLRALTGSCQEFQIDLVDGDFVPHRSWPFTTSAPREALERLRPYIDQFAIECDCMVREPLQYFDTLVSLGIERFIVHYGSFTNWDALRAHKEKYGYELGLAFTNDVPLTEIIPLLPDCQFVQVMGIAAVGAQGQPFDERTLETVTTLRSSYPALEIAIDGAVNEVTIPRLKQAGANRFAPGSAISKSPDPVAAYKHLVTIMQTA